MDALNTLIETLLGRLVWTSVQTVILIAVVYLICRLLPRLSSAMRCALWWLVGVQLIIGLCWGSPVELPLLAPVTPASVSQVWTSNDMPMSSGTEVRSEPNLVATPASTPATSAGWMRYWRHALLSIWLAALIAQCVMAIRQWRAARRLLHESHTPDETLQIACAKQAQQAGLRQLPNLRLSTTIASPQVTGLWRPTVLLPAGQQLTPNELAMALAHEMAHLRRGDLWLGWVPLIAQRLFFFHPLVVWAMREYALEREAACDEQVLQHIDAQPHAYGELLLRLGVIRPPHAGLAGASPTFQNLKRRLIMLQQKQTPSRRSGVAWLLIAVIALVGVLPYRVTAGSPDQTGSQSSLPAPPPVPPAPPATPPSHMPPPPPAQMPPPPPPPPAAPPAPPPPPMDRSGFSAHHVNIDTASDSTDGFALLSGDTVTVNGTNSDLAIAKRLQQGNQPVLWFRHDDKAWIVRDKTTLERARAIYQPVSQIAQEQGKLAGKQGELAGRQAGIAARSAAFAGRQAGIAERQAALAEQTMDASAPASAAVEARRNALQAQQAALSQEQSRLQSDTSKKQSELSAQQAALSRQQAGMSQRQQQASQKADHQMRQLMDEARARGLAQPAAAR